MSEFNVTFGDTIENPYILPIASNETLGGVKIGENIIIDENGVISINNYELPIATSQELGGVKIGDNINIDENGIISTDKYELPVATANQLGGVKIGSGLNINNGVVSVDVIGISQGTIATGVNTVVIDYNGILIGMMAWQGSDFVLTNLSCNISNNQITFSTNDNVTIPINCTVVYLKEG